MKIILPLISAFCFLCTGFLQAEPCLDHPLTLSELVDIALQNNPSTKQAWWNANRAAAALGSAKKTYYPNIYFNAGIRNGRDFKFINGPDTNYTIAGADLFLDMLLIDFGERKATVDMAKSALLAANWQTDWTIQKVMVKVLENAYSTLYEQEALLAAQVNLSEAEKVLNAAKELNRTGLTPITDFYTAQATFYQMRMDYTQHKASMDIQRGKLAASMGLPATSSFQIAVPETFLNTPEIRQIEDLIAIALEQRADVLAKQAKLQESLFNKVRTKAAYLPKIVFNGRGGYNKYLHDKTDSAQYAAAINFETPIFNGFDTMYQNRIAYADAEITTEQLVELQIDIALEVLTYSRQIQAAQEMLQDAQDNQTNSTKAYEGVLEKYKAGKETITDVSVALRQLAASRIRLIGVKTNLLISMANLAYATGTLAPYMETPCQENP